MPMLKEEHHKSSCTPGRSQKCDRTKSASVDLEPEKKIKRVVRCSLAAETSSMATCMEQLDWMRTLWSQMTTAEFSMDNYDGALKKQPALLVTDCKSLYDAIHKEAAPASTDKRLAIELAIVKSRATEGEANFWWMHGTRLQPVSQSTHRESLKRHRSK